VLSHSLQMLELTFSETRCINDEGMNGLGNHTKLKILLLCGDNIPYENSFDLNCVEGNFPHLEVFEMEFLAVGKWKLGNGAM